MDSTCIIHGLKYKHAKLWFEDLNGREYYTVLGVDGRIILKWFLGK
jgi:hypothetical protein